MTVRCRERMLAKKASARERLGPAIREALEKEA